ncbi:ABC transporter substrate-binding protein [Roseomonas sp. AR75]|uniref:ABC transporter substrate-binding protein n=1 Tax=Roseomonas sp. AR75 TaxID=2562311 RepID=UPI0010C0DA22|nr:sugar ABC transporter substrate-binding protein [Roseomonas sp. AR75]
MTARITRRGALGTALALSAPAIGSAQSPTTITMWTFLDPNRPGGRETALKQIIASFEQANPNLRVRVEPQVWTTMAERFVLAANARNAPDIVWVNDQNLALLAESDAAADLKPMVDAWPQSRRDDQVLPAAFRAATMNGKLQAVPLMATSSVLMVRRDLLAAAGKTMEDLRTWDGVVEVAKAMTKDTNGDGQPDVWGIGLGLATERFSFTPAILAAVGLQGGLFGDGCRARLATPDVARAIQWQADLILKHRVTPREAVATTSDDAIDQFAAGRYGMQVIANSRFEQIQRTAAGWNKDALTMAPTPGWTADRPGPQILGGWFGVAWRGSPRVREAVRFIDHMSSADSMALWNLPGQQVPMLKSIAARPEMQEQRYAHLRQMAEFFARSGYSMPSTCAWSRTLADFNLATQQVVLGQRTVMEALRIAERATQDRQ